MFLALQFVIVSASITSTVLGSDSGIHTCHQESRYKFNDKLEIDEYEIYFTQVNTTDANVIITRDFQTRTLYANIQSITIDFSSYPKRVWTDEHPDVNQDDSRKLEVHWKFVGHAAVTARIVQNDSKWQYAGGDGDCQMTAFTKYELWGFENASVGRVTTDFPPEWHLVSVDAKTAVRKIGLSCLREWICEKVKTFLQYTNPDTMEINPQINLTLLVNDAVDESLINVRQAIKKLYDPMQLSDILTSLMYNGACVNAIVHLVATGGTYINLSTIQRSGVALATIQPDEYSVMSTYTFPGAYILYDNINVQFEMTEAQGELFISLEDLKITGNSVFNAIDCHKLRQHVNVTNIGEVKYELRRLHVLRGAILNSKGQVSSSINTRIKELIESSLVSSLVNAFEYRDTIFGPCMTHLPKMGFPIFPS